MTNSIADINSAIAANSALGMPFFEMTEDDIDATDTGFLYSLDADDLADELAAIALTMASLEDAPPETGAKG